MFVCACKSETAQSQTYLDVGVECGGVNGIEMALKIGEALVGEGVEEEHSCTDRHRQEARVTAGGEPCKPSELQATRSKVELSPRVLGREHIPELYSLVCGGSHKVNAVREKVKGSDTCRMRRGVCTVTNVSSQRNQRKPCGERNRANNVVA